VKQVGRELSVRYVLEGGARKAGNRIRVAAQLIEGETGNHFWPERYDRDLADMFAVQEDITEAVTIAVAPAIANAELRRAIRKPPGSLDAWGAFQRGLWHMKSFSPHENAESTEVLSTLHPPRPEFRWRLLGARLGSVACRDGTSELRSAGNAKFSGEIDAGAVGLNEADAEARSSLAFALLMRGDHYGDLAEAERALALSQTRSARSAAEGPFAAQDTGALFLFRLRGRS
jgi:adenylate cyclase